tara:strand:+ start:4681 stop:5850 length:1170 start_codon:yes stop_codon:yes gene_type:complete
MSEKALGAAGIVLGGLGMVLGARASSKAAAAQNKAIRDQFRYDNQNWQYGKEKLETDRDFILEGIDIARKNDITLKNFKDTNSIKSYGAALKIRNYQQTSLNKQYTKSNALFKAQLSHNKMAATAAKEAEYRKLKEITQSVAFQNQDMVLESLMAEGDAIVRGSGRSGAKAAQAVMASLGMNQAKLAESLISAERNTAATIRDIARDQYGANLAALANKMIHPGTLPTPEIPLATPLTEYQEPRELEAFDFGPKPIKGAQASSLAGWANAISGLGNSITAFANYQSNWNIGSTGNTGSQHTSTYQSGNFANQTSGASDIRLKENIVKVGKALSGLNIYEWSYKSAPNSRYRGVIAQEVIKIFPEAVIKEKDGFLSVIYDFLDVNMELIT